jgi:dihydroorotate dehydrogenase electron transfer subunit
MPLPSQETFRPPPQAPGLYEVPITAHVEVAPQHFRLAFACPEIAAAARAGQFVHVLPRGAESSDPLLRRAFSILSTRPGEFDVLYRVMGRGTKSMSGWRVGDQVSLIGPLGRPFPALTARSILVGGGVGVPPLAMLASEREGQNLSALLGARRRADVLCEGDFAQHGVPVEIATDDGSAGHHGFVTELLQRQLQKISPDEADEVAIFTCGPLPMLRRVAHICAQFGVACHASLEEIMPCGVGVCNGCVVPVRPSGSGESAADEYSSYRRTCVEGPVFDAAQIHWEKFDAACPT